MNFQLEYIRKKMAENGFDDYEVSQKLIEIAASSTETISARNDYYFFANAFTSGSNPIDATIVGLNDAMKLKPHILQTLYYKFKFFFQGQIKIVNKDISDTLYVEFLLATPRKWKN